MPSRPKKLTKTAIRKFMNTVQEDNLDGVREQLQAHPALLHATAKSPPKKNDGQSALQLSIKAGAFEVAKFLIESGIDVDFIEQESVNEWKVPVLHDAIMGCMYSKHPEDARSVLLQMLDAGADPNARDSYGNDALGRAMLDSNRVLESRENARRSVQVFADLLHYGADPQASCETRPAVDADSRGTRSYRFLVEAQGGADDWRGAVWRDAPSALNGDETPDPNGRPPLITAAIFGSRQVLESLLHQGVEIDATDQAGWTALGLAWWSQPTSKLLLEHGANPNHPLGDSGATPFSRTFYKKELAELMLRHGADPETRNARGLTYEEVQAASRVP